MGVFKSSDGGTTWTPISPGVKDNKPVQALAIDPSPSTAVYTGINGEGVFKTTNGGISWTAINSGLTDKSVQALAIDTSTSGTLFAGTTTGIFRTTDGGINWTAIVKGADVQTFATDPSTAGVLYAGTSRGVLKGSNGGANWVSLNGIQAANVVALAIDPANPSTLYAGLNGAGIVKSTNGGTTWQPTGAGTIEPPASTMAKISGDNQRGAAGQPLRYPLKHIDGFDVSPRVVGSERTPSDLALFTRAIPAASSGARSPLSAASAASFRTAVIRTLIETDPLGPSTPPVRDPPTWDTRCTTG